MTEKIKKTNTMEVSFLAKSDDVRSRRWERREFDPKSIKRRQRKTGRSIKTDVPSFLFDLISLKFFACFITPFPCAAGEDEK